MDGLKGGKWTVAKVNGPSKVDGPSESGRSRVRVDGPSESRPSQILNDLWGNRTVQEVKVDGLKDDSGRFKG